MHYQQSPAMPCAGGLTDVPGILVGSAEDAGGRTGCTVILCPHGEVVGMDMGGAGIGN